jgi:hypothetical protein
MCLDTITKRYDPPDETVRKAYKVFEVFLGQRRQIYYPIAGGTGNERDMAPDALDFSAEVWLKSTSTRVMAEAEMAGIYPTYPSGFHAFVTEDDARSYAGGLTHSGTFEVSEIEIRGVETEGGQSMPLWSDLAPVLVAREMFVPKPEEGSCV